MLHATHKKRFKLLWVLNSRLQKYSSRCLDMPPCHLRSAAKGVEYCECDGGSIFLGSHQHLSACVKSAALFWKGAISPYFIFYLYGSAGTASVAVPQREVKAVAAHLHIIINVSSISKSLNLAYAKKHLKRPMPNNNPEPQFYLNKYHTTLFRHCCKNDRYFVSNSGRKSLSKIIPQHITDYFC